jgi:hypothetical protein
MPELRVTIVVADDPDAETVRISAMGDAFLPGPIEKSVGQFAEAWLEFGQKLDEFRTRPEDKKPQWPA